MRTFSPPLFVCLTLLAALGAQNPSISAPPGHEKPSAYGFWYTDNLGGYSTGRMQFADGSLRGKQRTLTGVRYRLRHYATYNPVNAPYNGLGRSWTRVTLTMAHTDMSKMTKNFDNNRVGTTTKVFDAKVTWPTVSSQANPNPSPRSPNVFVANPEWGKPIAFPFSSNFVYSGNADLLFDYDFHGGTLANSSVSWGGALRPYPMDGISTNDKGSIMPQGHLLPSSGLVPCWDSGLPGKPTSTAPAQAFLSAVIYGDQVNDTRVRGTIQLIATTHRTARGAPIIAALALEGYDNGLDVAARCNRMYVNPSKVLIYLGGTTTNDSINPTPSQPLLPKNLRVPYNNAFAGTDLYFQGAWTDSNTSAFSLASCSKLTLPRKPGPLMKRSTQRYTRAGKFNPSTDGELQHLPLLTVK